MIRQDAEAKVHDVSVAIRDDQGNLIGERYPDGREVFFPPGTGTAIHETETRTLTRQRDLSRGQRTRSTPDLIILAALRKATASRFRSQLVAAKANERNLTNRAGLASISWLPVGEDRTIRHAAIRLPRK
jgi:hypothetical protein